MEESVIVELKGTIVLLPYAVGSKSESIKPHLYVNSTQIIKVMKEGDNPFENTSLTVYDGHYVLVKGHYGFGNTFIITEIIDLSDEYNKLAGSEN